MSFLVRLSRQSQEDLTFAWRYAARRAPASANRWLQRVRAVIETLAVHPDRCPVCREGIRLGRPVRELLVGRRPNVYRVLFLIVGDEVIVLRVRRAQRRWLTDEEMWSGLDDDPAAP